MNSLKDSDFMVFSGTANLPLAEKVASYLGKPLNKIDIKHFPDGETFCQVQEGVRGRDVFVIQSGSPAPNEAYMELFIIMDALKRGSAARITAVIPYYGYARQDRKDQPRVPITARLVANLITAAGADRVLTLDLHANQIQGFFNIPLDQLHAEPVILKYIRDLHLPKPIVVAPDTGGAKTAYGYSRKLGTGLAIVAKQRTGGDTVDAFSVVGDVKDCDVIMIDDMTATGGTLSAAAKMCRDNGAKSVRGPARRARGDGHDSAPRGVRPLEAAVQAHRAQRGPADRRGDQAHPRQRERQRPLQPRVTCAPARSMV